MKSRQWQWARLLIPLLLLVSAMPALPAAGQTPPQFPYQWDPTTGHTDSFYFDPITTPDVLVLSVSVTATASFWPPDQTLFVANNTQYSTTDPPYYTMYTLTAPHPVLGGQAGDTVWVLPADYTEFSPGFDRDPAVTSANGWSDMTLILDALELPAGATFAMWSSSGTVRFHSSNPYPQIYNTGIPAHSHINWGFTKIGKYVLTVRGQLTHTVDGTPIVLTSDTYHYTVCVIDETGASAATILRECGIDQGAGPARVRRQGVAPTPTVRQGVAPTPTVRR